MPWMVTRIFSEIMRVRIPQLAFLMYHRGYEKGYGRTASRTWGYALPHGDTRMSRKFQLTWFAARGCWKRKFQGKVYYLGRRKVLKGDREAYQEAMREWLEIEAKLNGPDRARDRMRQEILAAGQEPSEAHLELDHHHATALANSRSLDASVAGRAIKAHALAFVDFYRTQSKLGQRSINRVAALRYYLNHMLDWQESEGVPIAGERPTGDIRASFCDGFYNHLAARVADGEIAVATAAATWAAFKQFVNWLWEREVIDLPRNIKNRALVFTVPAKKIETLDLEMLRGLLAIAPDKTRLYCLLAMNIGATGRDIADLAPHQIDWQAGVITRKRSKTAKHESVPTVSYKLWAGTLRLLKQFKSTDPNRLLLTESGTPLITQSITANDKIVRVDSIRLAWRRARKKAYAAECRIAKQEGRKPGPAIQASFTKLRKTSSTLLKSHPVHRDVVQMWLGHAPRTMADKHYAAPSQKQFDAAVKWLGEQFQMCD